MADEIVVRYDADVKKLEDKLKGIEKEQLAIDKNAKVSGQTITDQSNKSAQALGKVEKQTKSLKNTFNDLSQHLPFAGAIQQVQGLGQALGGVGKAATQTSGSFKILRAAIISTGIGALIVAIVALISYFRRTDEGATRLQGVMGALGASLDIVTGFVAELGSKIFDAFTSFENFQKAVIDLGKAIVQNLINRLTAIITLGEAVGNLFTGDFKEALKKANDAVIQANLGIKDGTDKMIAFGQEIAKAAEEAYNFALAMDAIDDAQRDLNISLSENRIKVIELIKQSKNHSFTIQERVDKLKEANKLDEEGLNKQLELETKRLKLIQERNEREKKSINQQLLKEAAQAKSLEEVNEIKKKALSINDDLADEEANQIIKINNLRAESVGLQERNNAAIANLLDQNSQDAEKRFQDELKRISLQEKLTIGRAKIDEASQGELIEIEQKFNKQRIDFLERAGKQRTGEYQELLLRQEELEKDYSDFLKKEWKARLDEFNKKEEDKKTEAVNKGKEIGKLLSGITKKQNDEAIAEEKRKADEIKAIRQQSLQEAISLTTQALNGINDLQLAKANAEIETERQAQDKITQDRLTAIDTRVKAGVISETQANSQKAKIQRDAAKKESELKRKQFEAEQKASINRINISTAEAIVKTLATYGFTPLAAVGIAAAIATGEIQKAIVRSQPVPKFEKGGKVLKGKSHREGGILIEAEGGERIFSKKTTKQYEPLFKSIQDGYFDKYADVNIVQPALKRERERNKIKEERERQAHEYIKSLSLNGLMDTSHLERLTKKNKNVNINNPGVIENAIEKGMDKALSKNRRGL